MRSERDSVCCSLYMPNFGRAANPRVLAKLAVDAERSGWDGFFLWDHLVEWDKRVPIYDSFTSLAAMALNTEHIRLGTTVTPLAKSKLWIVARQTTTPDHISNGCMGLGTRVSQTDLGDLSYSVNGIFVTEPRNSQSGYVGRFSVREILSAFFEKLGYGRVSYIGYVGDEGRDLIIEGYKGDRAVVECEHQLPTGDVSSRHRSRQQTLAKRRELGQT